MDLVHLSDSLRHSLRLRLSIGQFEPISGLFWLDFQEQFYIDSD